MKPKSIALSLLSLACVVSSALAAPPMVGAKSAPFNGTISRVLDGDTYMVKRDDGTEQKIRLHYGDAPEVAHNSKEKDQPHGRDALEYVKKWWLGRKVKVTPRGTSYDRIVADVDLDPTEWEKPDHLSAPDCGSLIIAIVSDGYAMLDPRYKPPEILRLNEGLAKLNKKGIWADQEKPPTPPWEWRKQKHTAEAKWSFKSFGLKTSLEADPMGDCDHPLRLEPKLEPKK